MVDYELEFNTPYLKNNICCIIYWQRVSTFGMLSYSLCLHKSELLVSKLQIENMFKAVLEIRANWNENR